MIVLFVRFVLVVLAAFAVVVDASGEISGQEKHAAVSRIRKFSLD